MVLDLKMSALARSLWTEMTTQYNGWINVVDDPITDWWTLPPIRILCFELIDLISPTFSELSVMFQKSKNLRCLAPYLGSLNLSLAGLNQNSLVLYPAPIRK